MPEVHIKDHVFFAGFCVKSVDRKKQEITFSFKGQRKGFDSEVSGNKLIDLLLRQAFNSNSVLVRGLDISYAEWGIPEASQDQPAEATHD